MSKNSKKLDREPLFHKCDPLQRQFPSAWRDIKFRRNSIIDFNGRAKYECPLCNKKFDYSNIDYLQGDHIWPYSLFGETSWRNYQLLCGSCNASKSNLIDNDIRKVLGSGEFCGIVIEFLRSSVAKGNISNSEFLSQMLDQEL